MTGSDPRAALLALIKYLGLSQREAASIIGIGEAALSRKLKGAERYDIREKDIETLRHLADVVDMIVDQACNHITEFKRQAATQNADTEVTLLVYRKDVDLPTWADLPFASVHMQAMSRVARQCGAELVMFYADEYTSWLCGRPDTQDARADWAAGYRRERLRFGLYIGIRPGFGIGWSALQMPPLTEKIDGGVVRFSNDVDRD